MTPYERRHAVWAALDADPDRHTAHVGLVGRIRARLDHNPRGRYAALTEPLDPGEQFATREAADEAERFRNS